MPYIPQAARTPQAAFAPETAGELNYALSHTLEAYLAHKGEKYQTYNDMIGALESLKLELYRRSVAPYEDQKIASNGDVPLFREHTS